MLVRPEIVSRKTQKTPESMTGGRKILVEFHAVRGFVYVSDSQFFAGLKTFRRSNRPKAQN